LGFRQEPGTPLSALPLPNLGLTWSVSDVNDIAYQNATIDEINYEINNHAINYAINYEINNHVINYDINDIVINYDINDIVINYENNNHVINSFVGATVFDDERDDDSDNIENADRQAVSRDLDEEYERYMAGAYDDIIDNADAFSWVSALELPPSVDEFLSADEEM
jgi:hypothetical protein